jgi:hypothetical protein
MRALRLDPAPNSTSAQFGGNSDPIAGALALQKRARCASDNIPANG